MAIIQVSTNGVFIEINFKDSTNKGKHWIERTINGIPFRGGKKNTLAGLEAVRDVYKNDPRAIKVRDREVKRTTFIYTDGKEKEEIPNNAQEIDLLYLFDVTSSMGDQIDSVKRRAGEIITSLKKKFTMAKLRTGFVGYRDTGDAEQYVIHKFTSNIDEFINWMENNVVASGGGDIPENVPGGLRKAIEMDWQAPLTRLLVHIADAPGHGDFQTKNSPVRREAEELLEELKCIKHVYSYLFLKPIDILKSTEVMIQSFKEISSKDCGEDMLYPANENKWFNSEPVSGGEIIERIIQQTEIAIEKIPYRGIKDDLILEDVGLIALGISSNADERKLRRITEPLYHKLSGPRSIVIIPAAHETLKDQKEKIRRELIGKMNMCVPNPCQNGGSCSEIKASTAECHCKKGYVGKTCDHQLSQICNDAASLCKLYGYFPPECRKEQEIKVLRNCDKKWRICNAHGYGSWC